MLKRLFKWFYRTLEFLTGFIIILLLLLVVRLWIEPIHIKNLSPLIQSMIPQDSTAKINISNAYIELALQRGHLLDIHLEKVFVTDGAGFILNVEDANVSLKPLPLLVGKVVVRDILLKKPYVQFDMKQTNQAQGNEVSKPYSLERKLNRVRRHFEDLNLLDIQGGELVFNLEENKDLMLSSLNVSFERKNKDLVHLSTSGELYFDRSLMNIEVDGLYSTYKKTCDLTVYTKDVELQKMQDLFPFLKGTNLHLDAKIKSKLDLKKIKTGWMNVFENVSFDVETEKLGNVYLPDPLNTTYSVENAHIKGKISPMLKQVLIQNSKVKTLGQDLLVNATLNNFDTFIQTQDFNQTTSELNASLHNIPVTEVPHLWPAYLGTDAHDWVKQNLVAGDITKATLNLKMQGVEIKDLTSIIDVQNAKVIYLDTMTPVEKVKAQVLLKPTHVDIKVIDGMCNGVQATGGFVNFLELDKDVPLFDAHIQLTGNIKDALQIVSAEPLNVCDEIPILCKTATGRAKGELQLAFPFSDALEDEFKFNVSADLEDAAVPVPQTNWQFRNGIIKLFVNNQKVSLKGRGLLDDKVLQMDIVQSLDKKTDASYEFKVPVSPSMIMPYFSDIDNFLKGNLLADIIIEPKTEDTVEVSLDFDLKDAEISLPIGYTKEFNQDGTLKATLQFKKSNLTDISSLYLSIPEENIVVKGTVAFPKNKLFELNLSEIKAPETDAKMTLGIYKNGAFDAIVTGKELQIKDLLHGDFFTHKKTTQEVEKIQSKRPKDFLLIAKLDKLYLSDDEPFRKVDIALKKNKGHWKELKGSFVSKVPFTFALNADKTALHVTTNDVGVFLKRAGYTDRISGGVLDTTLVQEKDGTLKGEILINDFKLTKTPFFMQAATLLGIVDAFSTDYISFSKAVIPFTLSPSSIITIENAVASGTAVGITIRGEISSEKIDLNGSIVPAYALNSLFGKIPVIGTLLSGEEGGGLFGVTYTVKGTSAQKEFDFNPASLLAPGIFRRLF